MPRLLDKEGRLRMLAKNKNTDNTKEKTLCELLGRSPDEADAAVLAPARRLAPGLQGEGGGGMSKYSRFYLLYVRAMSLAMYVLVPTVIAAPVVWLCRWGDHDWLTAALPVVTLASAAAIGALTLIGFVLAANVPAEDREKVVAKMGDDKGRFGD